MVDERANTFHEHYFASPGAFSESVIFDLTLDGHAMPNELALATSPTPHESR
jgi:hypothetical protein